MVTARFARTLSVNVEGRALPDDLMMALAGVEVDENLHLPDRFTLRFCDRERLVLAKSGIAIGTKLRLTVQAPRGDQRVLVSGEVTALEVELDAAGTFTIVRGHAADDTQQAKAGDTQEAKVGDAQEAKVGDAQEAKVGDAQEAKVTGVQSPVVVELGPDLLRLRSAVGTGDRLASFEGVCRGNLELSAGVQVAVGNLGLPFDGEYRLSRVRQVFDLDGSHTTIVAVEGQAGVTTSPESLQQDGIWLHAGDGQLKVSMDGSRSPVITVHNDGKVVVEARDGVDIDAGNGGVKITGGQRIELKAKTGISLDAGGGDVQVKGVNVDLKGSAQATLTAGKVGITGQASTEINGGASLALQAALVKIN